MWSNAKSPPDARENGDEAYERQKPGEKMLDSGHVYAFRIGRCAIVRTMRRVSFAEAWAVSGSLAVRR